MNCIYNAHETVPNFFNLLLFIFGRFKQTLQILQLVHPVSVLGFELATSWTSVFQHNH